MLHRQIADRYVSREKLKTRTCEPKMPEQSKIRGNTAILDPEYPAWHIIRNFAAKNALKSAY